MGKNLKRLGRARTFIVSRAKTMFQEVEDDYIEPFFTQLGRKKDLQF